MTCLSISDGFSLPSVSFFFHISPPTHTQMLCSESCNCTSYHSQKFLPRCRPSVPSTVQTQGSRAAHTINRPFPLLLVPIDSQFKTRCLVHIYKGELISLCSCPLLWRVQRPVICVRNPIFQELGLYGSGHTKERNPQDLSARVHLQRRMSHP